MSEKHNKTKREARGRRAVFFLSSDHTVNMHRAPAMQMQENDLTDLIISLVDRCIMYRAAACEGLTTHMPAHSPGSSRINPF